MDDDLFTYEVKIPKLSYSPSVEQQMDDLDNGNLDVYERKLWYDECEKMYAEARIFINKRLVRLIDVTVEQWLLLASAAICKNGGVTDLVSRANVIENKVKTLTITTFLFPSKKVLRAAISPGMNDVFPRPSYSNLEDAFSSNFPNYVPPASPDYVPASPGKTYSSASNLFGIAPLASPTLSLFPDDPYMKALQAFL
ncbi:hypothetical protein Tco_0902656 [Tanacetum coccineum]